MLTRKQVKEIRDALNNSANPLFFFDNDPDGLCSFILLQKYIQRGKGFPIKSLQDFNDIGLRKISEFSPDCLFILDKPVVPVDFFRKTEEMNLPVIWIDHHQISKNEIPNFIKYYNPLFNRKKSNEPTTALCAQINDNKNFAWLAVAGCISDKFFPKFYRDFRKKYPDLAVDSKDAFDIYYNSEIGRITRIFSFALKDRTTNVINMMKFLSKANSPYEILEDTSANHTMHERFEQINSRYQKLLEKALKNLKSSEKILFFRYGGDMAVSADLSNELSYKFPEKIIIVVYISEPRASISVRGKKILQRVVESLKGLDNATGGGHEDAAGVQMKADDVEKFMEKFRELTE